MEYVELAERVNGPIPRAAGYGYIWGEALAELARARPDARIVNLETSITTSEQYVPKGINYRMHPANAPVLSAAGIDCCVLANNHTLDWGASGLLETIDTLAAAGIATAGAGRDLRTAEAPAVLPAGGAGRVLVFAFATMDSGIPPDWAARVDAPGVELLPDLGEVRVEAVARRVRAVKRARDVAVASVHWGGNWGFEIAEDQRRFAHALIDNAGIDLVHGHSSHHPKGIEVYRGHLILYGCGDFVNDYEGIGGYEAFRGDLRLMYFATLDRATGRLLDLRMMPLQIHRFRLRRPSAADRAWLLSTLDRECRGLGNRVVSAPAGAFVLRSGARPLGAGAPPAKRGRGAPRRVGRSET